MRKNKFVCFHGHFYQPPRENPWLESIEIQDSAFPFHDWNERITAECYEPNTASPILGNDGTIHGIMNNLSKMSFNFGPTLLAWLRDNKPEVYEGIRIADKLSLGYFGGHGSAIAQCFNHIIMPLASRRDKVTQVQWGIKDFEFHFNRFPEGMWLSETAADTETLEVLAEAGIRFTILSPFQAKAIRKLGSTGEWYDVAGGKVPTTRPYQVNLPSGRHIVVFFYDGTISQEIAFGNLLENGEAFAERVLSVFAGGNHFELSHIATDGETYGHHHRFGDMALAYAISSIEQNSIARITNYSQFLSLCPPVDEAQIIENTSWSCNHGVSRWLDDCGCNSGLKPKEWHQQWRKPLRQAFDWLREHCAPLFENKMKPYTHEPWQVRDAYVEVMLNRNEQNARDFLERYCANAAAEEQKIEVLKLLEMQRHLLLMYTSCGWFFDDISGIETVQCIEYSARALQLAQELSEKPIREEFLEKLSAAKSNVHELEDGKIIFEKLVEPSMADLVKIAVHYAVLALSKGTTQHPEFHCYQIESRNLQTVESGKARLLVGQTVVKSLVTLESVDLCFAVFHLGDHNFFAGAKPLGQESFDQFLWLAREAFARADFPTVIHEIDQSFEGRTSSLKSLFRDVQREALSFVTRSTIASLEGSFRKFDEDYMPLMRFMMELHSPLPSVLHAITTLIHRLDFEQESAKEQPNLERLNQIVREAEDWELEIDILQVHAVYEKLLYTALEALREEPFHLERLKAVVRVAESIRELGLAANLWNAQRSFYFFAKNRMELTLVPRSLGEAEREEWKQGIERIGELLKVKVTI